MFYDKAKIYIRSGDGGDGMISFRREKHVPYGGPNGGDGGRGGAILFVTNDKMNSLVRFHRGNHFRAEHASHGGTTDKNGAAGKTLVLQIPLGTVIRDAKTGEQLADLTIDGQEYLAAEGGRGGRGNIHFANSVDRAPRIAERGEPGKEQWLNLELKLIADVGLVGVPNAGKSTLLSVISSAKPKIASYPFTTLRPSLGVVALGDYDTMLVADIPGLIEGAADGIGLGHDFLRHVERTQVLIHLIDGAASDPLVDWAMINQELAIYDENLAKRPQLVVLNKMDLPDAIAWEPILEEEIVKAGYEFCAISAVSGEGLRPMLYKVKEILDAAPPLEEEELETLTIITPAPDKFAFTIEPEGFNTWRVSGPYIERVAAMTYFEFDETLIRFQQILEASGIAKALNKAGVKAGDMVHIGNEALEWGEE